MSRLRPGRTIRLSPYRKLMTEWLSYGTSIPLVSIERSIRIPEVVKARLEATPRPSWLPILLKAYSIANVKVPEFRRAFLSFPYRRLYEHASTTAAILVEREVKGESVAFTYRLSRLEDRSLAEIDERIRTVKKAPLESLSCVRTTNRFLKMPWAVRKLAIWLAVKVSGSLKERFIGTFSCSSIHGAGATPIHPICLQSTILTFGSVADDGTVNLRLSLDHRVMDGVTAARGLVETEKALNGPILDELRSMAKPQALAKAA